MNTIPKKIEKKIEEKIKQGIRIIIVEGAADKYVYQRFYPSAEFIYGNGASDIIKLIKECNKKFGKTPLITAIIDKDLRTEKDIALLTHENIYTLGVREIESIFLRPAIISKMFGTKTFSNFSQNIIEEANKKFPETINDYNEALHALKEKVSSKYNIRLLMKTVKTQYRLKMQNKGNDKNIEFLCQRMDETDSWNLLEGIIPKLPEVEEPSIPEKETKTNDYKSKREKMQSDLRNFVPNQPNIHHSENPNPSKKEENREL